MEIGWGVWQALVKAGRAVPEEVGLLVAGDDSVLLEQINPSLTGILEDRAEVGRICAQCLHEQMRGLNNPAHHHVPPMGVISRGSLLENAGLDPLVARARRQFRKNLADPASVEDICRQLNCSPATLLRRFKASLGCTPKEDMQQIRLQHAQQLIRETEQPLSRIAEACGFGLQSALSRAVRQALGKSPSNLRQEARSSRQSTITGTGSR